MQHYKVEVECLIFTKERLNLKISTKGKGQREKIPIILELEELSSITHNYVDEDCRIRIMCFFQKKGSVRRHIVLRRWLD